METEVGLFVETVVASVAGPVPKTAAADFPAAVAESDPVPVHEIAHGEAMLVDSVESCHELVFDTDP